MKNRTSFYIVMGLLVVIVGVALLIISSRNQEPIQTFPATINRDCAPWDGSAFTVSILYGSGGVIDILIWQPPDIKSPVTFSFPDQTGQVRSAFYHPSIGLPEQLTGKVFFRSVEQGNSVAGRFDLLTEKGQQFKGQFEAIWGDLVVYCG